MAATKSKVKVIIVGGGPVGLTAAHALYHAGIDFVVLERRESVVLDQGASLVIGPPSMRVMHQLGLLDRLLEIGAEVDNNTSLTHEGYKFGYNTAYRLMGKNHGIAPVAFHRAQLIQTIYDGLPPTAKEKYLTNKKVVDIASDDLGARVTCADGSIYEGSVVIGADGVHSKTRRMMRNLALAEDPKRHWDSEAPFTAVYKCMWCSFPSPGEPGETTQTHNKDHSTMYITGRERGWIFLYERLPEPTSEYTSYTEKDISAFAAKFAEYPITENLKVKNVYEHRLTEGMANLEEGILDHWSWGRIALAGDACHKFTPNAGLGLNSGIQDVVALCNGLHEASKNAPDGTLDTATLRRVFDEYQTSRSELLQRDATQSARLARLHAWANLIYFFVSRFILSWAFVQAFLVNHLAAGAIRKGRVLDYIAAKEPFQGKVAWVHEMKE